MNRLTLLPRPARSHRLLFAALASLALSGACSDDDEGTAAPPADLALTITSLDGQEPAAEGSLRCDGLAVQVEIEPARGFTLRPLNACGSSGRCGYLHVEGLDADDNVLGSVDSVTTLGLLELPSDALERLVAVRAVLLRGIDGEPVTNRDRSEVETRVEVNRAAPASCQEGGGGQGQGGGSASAGAPAAAGNDAGGAPASGGAPGLAGADTGGAPAGEPGGAGGAPASAPSAGSGGA